jgi:hypothetical protein
LNAKRKKKKKKKKETCKDENKKKKRKIKNKKIYKKSKGKIKSKNRIFVCILHFFDSSLCQEAPWEQILSSSPSKAPSYIHTDYVQNDSIPPPIRTLTPKNAKKKKLLCIASTFA